MIPEGKYVAKAIEHVFGISGGQDQKEQVGVAFEITRGDHTGESRTWYGYFNSKENQERTFAALKAAGGDIRDLEKLPGLGSTEVQIVIKHEEYQGEWRDRIAFVNPIGGVAMKNPLKDAGLKAFIARQKGAVVAFLGASGGAPVSNGAKPAPKAPAAAPAVEDDPFA